MRVELQGRTQELEGVRELLASLQNEHQQTLQDLQDNCHKLHEALQEKDALKEEVGRGGVVEWVWLTLFYVCEVV